jgi:hypothetical protein
MIRLRVEKNHTFLLPGKKQHTSSRFFVHVAGRKIGAFSIEEGVGKAMLVLEEVTLAYTCQDCDAGFDWPHGAQDHGWRCDGCAAKRKERGLPRWDMRR